MDKPEFEARLAIAMIAKVYVVGSDEHLGYMSTIAAQAKSAADKYFEKRHD